MMSHAETEAVHRKALETVRERLKQIDEERDRLKIVESYHDDQLKWLRMFATSEAEKRPLSEMTYGDAAAEILRGSVTPKTPTEIARQMIDAGFAVPDQGFARLRKSVSSALSRRDDVFASSGDGRWHLVGG